MKTSNKIIDRIKNENIKPIPKWVFITKNLFIWCVFLLSIAIGAAAFSIILFAIQQTNFDLISHMSHSRFEWFLGLLPFFWIFSLIIFTMISIFSFYHSKKGYKLPWSKLVKSSITLSILLGSLFFIAGGAGKLEQAFAVRVSLYESIQEKKIKIWMMPEEGFLTGYIENVQDSTFLLIDIDSTTWTIDFHGAFIPPVVFLEKGEQVKLVGKMTAQTNFKADEVRPWGGPEHRNKTKREAQ